MEGSRSLWTHVLLFLAIIAVGLFGCTQDSTSQAEGTHKATLLLYCGAGLQPPAADLVKAFSRRHNCNVETDYAGSEVLLSRITLNRKGDLYMPGDTFYVDLADDTGLIDSATPVCHFVATMLVAKGNPKGITSLHDLTRDGIRLGLGDAAACAIGLKSRNIFAQNNIPWTSVQKTLTFQSLTVNELGVQIQAGSLDAVIVWGAVAEQYLEHGDMVEIPTSQNVISTVSVGVLSFSKHKELAKTFADFATSEQGRAILRKHRYCVNAPAGLEE